MDASAASCRDISFTGRTWTFCNHTSGTVGGRRAAAMIWVHCLGCSAETDVAQADPDNLLLHTQRHGFALALPHGVERSFNAERCCGQAMQRGVNDTGFVVELALALGRMGYGPIFLGGFSNGGFLTALLAQTRWASHFQGFAMLAGYQYTLPVVFNQDPVPVMIQHGMRDKLVSFGGCCNDPTGSILPCGAGIKPFKQCVGAPAVAQVFASPF